jgi:hypothetical protein
MGERAAQETSNLMIVAMRFKSMHRCSTFALFGLFGITTSISATELQEVASFPHQQVTGVAVSKSRRVFVNFPSWSDDHTISVAELVDGKPKAFPNGDWNKAGAPESHFVCVQSVYVDPNDDLWIIDAAAPKMQEVVKGGPKLVKVDLKTNQVAQNSTISNRRLRL